MSDTYSVPMNCSNCNHRGEVQVPKGTLVPANAICPNCGCATASKQMPVPQQMPGPYSPYTEPWRKPEDHPARKYFLGGPSLTVPATEEGMWINGPHNLHSTARN